MTVKSDMVFEVSWEVCNKVGGIYTVVQSKTLRMIEQYKENYILVGPYFPSKAQSDYQEKVPPKELKDIFENLKKDGIVCHYGNWLIKGMPKTILIEFSGFIHNKDAIKSGLWESFGIDSLGTEFYDYDQPMIWSTAVGRLIEEYAKKFPDKKVSSQFHEWMAGGALLHLKKNKIKVGTVFTTHATMLGRTIASADVDLYKILDQLNPEEEAKKRKVLTKFQTERACAKESDVFSTVSEITGIEAEKILGRKPDVLVLNGLDLSKFPTFEGTSIKHKLFKERIKEFLMFYFFPYYSFDLDDTLIYFIAGRYEFHDKGIDILIDGLSKLNERLKKDNSNRTVVTFFWVPGNIRGIRQDILENASYYRDIKALVDENLGDIKHKLIYNMVSQKKITPQSIYDEETTDEMRRRVFRFKREGNPPLSTHELYNEDTDQILNYFRAKGLNNNENDRVKVIYYPIYLTGADGLLDTNYYESMLGSHLGVFPSCYEPWGYTPLEAAALGVASVTTDLAGFGRYIKTKERPEKIPGIFINERYGKTYDFAAKQLADFLYQFASYNKQERIKCKMQAKQLAGLADWESFIKNYTKAHDMAITKAFGK